MSSLLLDHLSDISKRSSEYGLCHSFHGLNHYQFYVIRILYEYCHLFYNFFLLICFHDVYIMTYVFLIYLFSLLFFFCSAIIYFSILLPNLSCASSFYCHKTNATINILLYLSLHIFKELF